MALKVYNQMIEVYIHSSHSLLVSLKRILCVPDEQVVYHFALKARQVYMFISIVAK